jgi:His-Xaa-Ser system protein HxsD
MATGQPEDSGAVVSFSTAIYSIDTVKQAAYRLSASCSFDFELASDQIVCRIIFPKVTTPALMDDIVRQFRNEVLDQDLRHRIAQETAAVRNVILANAFSRTGLQGGE